jgi:hypothetical protein
MSNTHQDARPKPGSPRSRRATGERPSRDAGTRVTSDPDRPPLREEYPGPQTASTGEHLEPGDVRPSPPRKRGNHAE